MITKPKLSNCLIQCLIFRFRFKKSKIKAYYNNRYKTISFYLVIDKTHEMRFRFRKIAKIKTKFLFIGINEIKKI